MTRKLQPFSWYGGKNRMFSFLLSHMPNNEHHFVDLFGGSGVVLLNRPASGIDTYNDIDRDLVNFFRVLRDEGEALINLLELTPYAREEFVLCCEKKNDSNLSDLERARMFYCRAMFAYSGMAQAATASTFSCTIDIEHKRRGVSKQVSSLFSHIEGLPDIIYRLRKVQIENKPALEILKRFDRADTFFYCDPPYVHATRGASVKMYEGEMNDAEHKIFADTLHSIKGRAMVSGYRGELYDSLFHDWRRVDEQPHTSWQSKTTRQESIWMNYSTIEGGDLI